MIESPYRHDFPFFDSQKKKLKRAYLDSAATTQKPSSVIEELVHFYTKDNANIYRGIYATSQRATSKFEAVRDKVKTFITFACVHINIIMHFHGMLTPEKRL